MKLFSCHNSYYIQSASSNSATGPDNHSGATLEFGKDCTKMNQLQMSSKTLLTNQLIKKKVLVVENKRKRRLQQRKEKKQLKRSLNNNSSSSSKVLVILA